MGLDVSHDAWRGSYGAFNRFRQALAKVIGGSFPPHDPEWVKECEAEEGEPVNHEWWYWEPDDFPEEHHHAAKVFLCHSDCDGEISPEDCIKVAAWLRWAAEQLTDEGSGHLTRMGGYAGAAIRFAEGAERAAEAGEPLQFY